MKKFLRRKLLNFCFVGGCFLNINTCNNTNLKKESLKLNQDAVNPANQEITTKTNQILAYHGNGWDTNVSGIKRKEIDFNQKVKRIFASESQPIINGNDAIISATQLTTPDVSSNTGSYRWGDAKHDTNSRIQDWKFQYIDNLKIKSKSTLSWGLDDTDLFLNNTNTWPKNTNFHSLVGKVVFQNGSDQSYEYQKATDFNLHIGVNKKFTNKSFSFYSIPYSKLKEVQYVYVVDNFVRRYLWSLQGVDTTDSLAKVETLNNDINLKVNKYRIKDLVCFTNANYKEGTIQIKFNDEFFKLSQYTKTRNEKLKEINLNELSNVAKQEFIKGINEYKIYDDNIETCFDKFKQMSSIEEIEDYLNKHQSNNGILAKKYNIGINDNPIDTIQYLINFVNVKLDYQIPNKTNPNMFDNLQTNISNDELKKGKIIKLSKNINGEYEIKLTNLISNEFIDQENYIAADIEDKISICSTNIESNKNDFILKMPKITSVSFNDKLPKFNKYCYDLTDEEILKEYVNTTDNYGNKDTGTRLNSNEYQIIRNEFTGNIYISIQLNEENYQKTISGFKIPDLKKLTFDSKKYSSLLFAKEINDDLAHKIIEFNGFDNNLLSSIKFKIDKINDKTGETILKVESCSIPDFNSELYNKKFTINNLTKYYLCQKQNIDKSSLTKQPSKITREEFINNFLDVSKEFLNLNNLNINLNSNDKKHTLEAQIKYNDYFSKETVSLNYEYTFSNKSSISKYWLIAVIGLGIIILSIGLFLYKKDNLKRTN